MIDSDRSRRGGRVNRTKSRVRDAIKEYGGNAAVWITQGYTIENYVPAELLTVAVTKVHSEASYEWHGDRYSNPLDPDRLNRRSAADKTAVAQAVVDVWGRDTRWPLDLQDQVAGLAASIRAANELPSA